MSTFPCSKVIAGNFLLRKHLLWSNPRKHCMGAPAGSLSPRKWTLAPLVHQALIQNPNSTKPWFSDEPLLDYALASGPCCTVSYGCQLHVGFRLP